MISKDRASTTFDIERILPVVRLPQSDVRKPEQAAKDVDEIQIGANGTTVATPSDGQAETPNKQTRNSAVQSRRIVVNIPSTGGHSKSTISGLPWSTNKSPRLAIRAPHLVNTSHSLTLARFQTNKSGKSRPIQHVKSKCSINLKYQKVKHGVAHVTSRFDTKALPSPSPSTKEPAETRQPRTKLRSPNCRSHTGFRRTAMPEARAKMRQQHSDGEGAHNAPSINNIYSVNHSLQPGISHINRTSSSQSWNDFAMITSSQVPARTPSNSPQDTMGRRRNQTMAHRASPSAYRPRGMGYRSNGSPAARRWDDWGSWLEVSVKIYGLTRDIAISDLWRCFSKEGTVITIEIFEDTRGDPDGKGLVRFRSVNTYRSEVFPYND